MKIRYSLQSADEAREFRHPQIVMREIANGLGFSITYAEGFAIGDCWIFTIDAKTINKEELPKFIDIIE